MAYDTDYGRNGNRERHPRVQRECTPPPDPSTMQRGFVRSLQIERGFGFLAGEDGVERFFHVSQLSGCRIEHLRLGQELLFVPEPERIDPVTNKSRGPRACNVRPAPPPSD